MVKMTTTMVGNFFQEQVTAKSPPSIPIQQFSSTDKIAGKTMAVKAV